MPTTEALTAFLERKLSRDWTAVSLSRGPMLNEHAQIDEVRVEEMGEQTPADLAALLRESAHADAQAMRTVGPYFVWVRRSDDDGQPIAPIERFPLTFEDCAATEANERSSLLSTQRELAIEQTRVQTDQSRTMLEFSRLVAHRHEAEVDRAMAALAAERTHSTNMAQLLFTTSQAAVQSAHAAAEALIQGDARRKTMMAEARNQQAMTAIISNLDVILPAIASGWMKANGQGNGGLDIVSEYKMMEEFLKSLHDGQFEKIGALLPNHLRMGIMQIYQGAIAAPLVPAAAAKIFAQIDGRLAAGIYELLDAAIPDPTQLVQAMDAEGKPVLNDEGGPVMQPALVQSKQQQLFSALWKTREHTLMAQGDAAMKQLGGA